MKMIALILGLFMALSLILWIFVIYPIIKGITSLIQDKIYPTIVDATKTIITLSTAAIIFTAGIVPRNEISKFYLKTSWIAFIICVFLSILLLFIMSLEKSTKEILLDKFTFLEQNKDDKIYTETIKKMLSIATFLVNTLFYIYYFQISSLLIGLILMLMFGVKNF